jgi:predicted dehydrogenase
MLLPHLRDREDVSIRAVCCATGISAKSVANRLRAQYCTTRAAEIFEDPDINTVLIGARHDLHAEFVIDALRHQKHVFIEKPLCLTEDELCAIEAAYADATASRDIVLHAGFNRRHSPHLRRVAELFAKRQGPLTMVYRVNAGALPAEHWLNDPAVGGGRVLGEACHFVDTLQALAGCRPIRIHAARSRTLAADHDFVATLEFADGSIGTLIYAVDGDRSIAKERVEVFGAGKSAVIDDFATTDLHSNGRRTRFTSRGRDKGFRSEIDYFTAAVLKPDDAEADFHSAVLATRATLKLVESLTTREPIDLE